jgi:antitoxin ParD1/3/4
MSTLTLTLPDSLKEFVESQVAKGGFGDANDYFLSLLEEQRRIQEDEAVLPLLIEAIESGPATPMTREDWDDIRRSVREKLANSSR